MFKNPKKFGMILNDKLCFSKLNNISGRFDDKETPYMAFKYEKTTPFGESMSNKEIVDNYMTIQAYLREHKLNF